MAKGIKFNGEVLKVPEKTSELVNDSGFITEADIPSDSVSSVNGKTGAVTLTAEDVNALPSTTKIPTALSDLSEDGTHRTVTDTEKATWNGKSDFSGNYEDLTNKPTIPTSTSQLTNDSNFVADSAYVHTDNNYTNDEKSKLSGIEAGAEVNPTIDAELSTSSENPIQNKAVATAINSIETQIGAISTSLDTINGEVI